MKLVLETGSRNLLKERNNKIYAPAVQRVKSNVYEQRQTQYDYKYDLTTFEINDNYFVLAI